MNKTLNYKTKSQFSKHQSRVYKKNCYFTLDCCPDIKWNCHRCHNEHTDLTDKHKFKNENVKIICGTCNEIQNKINNKCQTCDIKFSEYFCELCCIFDIDKQQYHCDGCGICRIGKNEFVHCNKCKCCRLLNHECKDNLLDNICPICIENLFESQINSYVLKCGHVIHATCGDSYFKTNYKCPFCNKAVVNMKDYFDVLDDEILNTPMPTEYDMNVDILCNECEIKSSVKFHIIGMKCEHCGTYNTVRI